jgi:S1-C subfamily serine protease
LGVIHTIKASLALPIFFCAAALIVRSAQAQPAEPSGLQAALALEQVLVQTIARAEPSVVAIASLDGRDDRRPGFRADLFAGPFGQNAQDNFPGTPGFIPSEYGTGVVVDANGLILTQYHVLRHGDRHWVTTSDRKTYPATIRAADPRSDLAVLQIEANNLTPIKFGDASQLRKGQIVIALGNPYAIARDGQVSASWGIVANLARKAGPVPGTEGPASRPTLHHFGTLIQTDAKLNLGTSGGALVNLRGEMVGLTTSMAATAGYETAAGYAVPVNAAFRRIIETLKAGREVEYGLLGVEPENLAPSEIRGGLQGLRVRDVWIGTPADRAGLMTGDIITHVNGKPLFDADGLIREVGKLPPASKVELRFVRDGSPQKLEIELSKYPVRGEVVATNRRPPWRGLSVDYATALPATEYQEAIRQGSIDFEGCVAITAVAPDSPAWRAGLREKMFIARVNNQRVRTPADFHAATAAATGPVRVRLTVPESEKPTRLIPAN